jgi:hypothetical protein
MKDFTMGVRKVMDSIEVMARRIETDENLKEYFVEAYGYLDGDDAVPALLAYIQENICQ